MSLRRDKVKEIIVAKSLEERYAFRKKFNIGFTTYVEPIELSIDRLSQEEIEEALQWIEDNLNPIRLVINNIKSEIGL
jgi:hypothetical protein